MSSVDENDHAPSQSGGSRPVPDPTWLTDKAIDKVKESLTAYVDGEIKNLSTGVTAAATLTKERFDSAERQRVEQKKDTKDAVDAALSAAKEAVKEQTTASERSIAKSETATRDQLKQQQETFATTTGGLGDKIEDLKERVSRIESTKVGATENRTSLYATVGIVISLLLVGMAVITFAITRLS